MSGCPYECGLPEAAVGDGAGGQGAVVTSRRNVSLCVPGLSIPRAAVCLSVAFLPPHSSF